MGTDILYGFLWVWTKLHAIFPLRILYILADILYFLIYRIGRYRVRVVRSNLSESFPEKSTEELRKIEKDFYHHFCDYIIETIKLAHISLDEIKKRAVIKNPGIIDNTIDNVNSTMFMLMGHYGNWEWYSYATALLNGSKIYQIYRPLNNKAFDRLFIYLRTRFGSVVIKKHDTVRDILNLKKDHKRAGVIFLQDQAPGGQAHYWTHLFNRETAMFTGSERIARKQNIPVFFLDAQKVKRGYYELEIIPITLNPKETPENWVTEEYTRLLERMIRWNPAYWLWTHKRWKYKREAE